MKTINLFIFIFLLAYAFEMNAQPTVNEHSIKFLNTSIATIVGEDGVILKTTNGGRNWVEQTSGITNVLYGFDYLDNNNSIAVGENGVTVKTTNGGTDWQVIASGSLEHLRDVEILNAQNVLICGDNGTILLSTDAGETYNLVQNITSRKLSDISFYNTNIGFIVGDDGTVLKTENGGQTWVEFSTIYGNLNSVGIMSESDVVAVGYNGTDVGVLFRSNDGGRTWIPYEEQFSLSTTLNDVVFFSSSEGIIVGENGLILRTGNGGISWSISPTSALSIDLFSVAFANANNGISVGENGTELYTTDGGVTWKETNPATNVNGSKPRVDNIISKNFPNPFNPSTTISYQLPNDANVQINVFDITGKQVASLFDGSQRAGNHSVKFDASNLSSGVYFYRITAISGQSKIVVTNRMLLTK